MKRGREDEEGGRQLLEINLLVMLAVLSLPFLIFLPHIPFPFSLQVGNVVRMEEPKGGLYPLIGLHSRGEKVCDNQWH